MNITLFTITHRATMFEKHHDYILRFDGSGNSTVEKI